MQKTLLSFLFIFLFSSLLLSSRLYAEQESWRDCDSCPAMVSIPAGSFVMGSSKEETSREGVPDHQGDLEHPQIDVDIKKAFALSETEITIEQFAAFVSDTGYEAGECEVFHPKHYWIFLPGSSWQHPPFPQQADHPVTCVSWRDAEAYTSWLSDKTNKAYRLPSEAEWEYAARAGTTTARYWGDELDARSCTYANVADTSSHRVQIDCYDSYPHSAPVRYGLPNDFGLYGMLGNMGEWTADCGTPDYATQTPRDGSPFISEDCDNHIGRGGSWWNNMYYLRSARRYASGGRYHVMGIRVAADLK